jgi:hypothetical protein
MGIGPVLIKLGDVGGSLSLIESDQIFLIKFNSLKQPAWQDLCPATGMPLGFLLISGF